MANANANAGSTATAAKTVNASVIIIRDGKTDAQNFPSLGYATFVALEASLSSVVTMLSSWGARRVAAMVDGKPFPQVSGDCDLIAELVSDFGPGTSRVTLAYTGISEADADEITAALKQAVAAVMAA